jgi:hypothetical protein
MIKRKIYFFGTILVYLIGSYIVFTAPCDPGFLIGICGFAYIFYGVLASMALLIYIAITFRKVFLKKDVEVSNEVSRRWDKEVLIASILFILPVIYFAIG